MSDNIDNNDNINVDGADYKISELTDEQRYFVNQIADVRSQLAQGKFRLDQLTVSENAFSKMLSDAIKADDASTDGQ
jgi:hypothetical protein|tara:strand:+ start:75 stop:305 length:231 start_codon:yes stop_codon:yes gene_type:complete